MFRAFKRILKFIFPPTCGVCNDVIAIDNLIYVCPTCYDKIKTINLPSCKYCGKVFDEYEFSGFCRECASTQHYYDMAICACEYSGEVKKLLHEFKFHKRIELYSVLSDILLRKIKKETYAVNFDIITSIPLHPNRLKSRGYNQSQLIAQYIGDKLGIRYAFDIVERVKDTHSQSELHRTDRISNVKNAFRIINPAEVIGKNILLIDDILTTGSTLGECSKMLKKVGAKCIVVATVATGRRDRIHTLNKFKTK